MTVSFVLSGYVFVYNYYQGNQRMMNNHKLNMIRSVGLKFDSTDPIPPKPIPIPEEDDTWLEMGDVRFAKSTGPGVNFNAPVKNSKTVSKITKVRRIG